MPFKSGIFSIWTTFELDNVGIPIEKHILVKILEYDSSTEEYTVEYKNNDGNYSIQNDVWGDMLDTPDWLKNRKIKWKKE